MSAQKILYIMACGHVGSGVNTQELLCNEHGWQVITDVHVAEWRVKCQTCNYARWCGLARVQALFLATKHKREYGSHIVGDEYIINPTARKEQEKLVRYGLISQS